MLVTFTVLGGTNWAIYDLFGCAPMQTLTNGGWAVSQVTNCSIYSIANQLTNYTFYALGTPQDTDSDGLTDAYELLVSGTDPNNPDSNGNGLLDAYDFLLGLDPKTDQSLQSGYRLNYTYRKDGVLNLVTGIRAETMSVDAEGNVLSISQ